MGAAATPATYTPRHLADKILTSRAAIEGEQGGRDDARSEQRQSDVSEPLDRGRAEVSGGVLDAAVEADQS